MKIKYTVGICLVLFVMCQALSGIAEAQVEPRYIAVQEMEEDENIYSDGLTDMLKNCLVTYISSIQGYVCLDREAEKLVAKEMAYQYSGMVDDAQRTQPKSKVAQYTLSMQFRGINSSKYMFTFKIIDIETARIIGGGTVMGDPELSDFDGICQKLRGHISEGFNVEATSEPVIIDEPAPEPVLAGEPTIDPEDLSIGSVADEPEPANLGEVPSMSTSNAERVINEVKQAFDALGVGDDEPTDNTKGKKGKNSGKKGKTPKEPKHKKK